MIIGFSDLKNVRERYPDKVIVYAGGVFDILHPGHVLALKKIKELGDVLVVGVTDDARTKHRKGTFRPIQSENDRLVVIDAIRGVDFAFIAQSKAEGEESPWRDILSALRPNIWVSCDESWINRQADIESFGTKLVIVPRQSEHATSLIIKKIQA